MPQVPVFSAYDLKDQKGSQRSLFSGDNEKSPSITCTALLMNELASREKEDTKKRFADPATEHIEKDHPPP